MFWNSIHFFLKRIKSIHLHILLPWVHTGLFMTLYISLLVGLIPNLFSFPSFHRFKSQRFKISDTCPRRWMFESYEVETLCLEPGDFYVYQTRWNMVSHSISNPPQFCAQHSNPLAQFNFMILLSYASYKVIFHNVFQFGSLANFEGLLLGCMNLNRTVINLLELELSQAWKPMPVDNAFCAPEN